MKIVIIGPPGSGKSTQAQIVAEKLGLIYISTGDIFRDIIKTQSNLGRNISNNLKGGLLVKDVDVLRVVQDRLSKDDVKFGFVIDGFPRNLNQAENSPLDFDKVVYIKVSDKECAERILSRKREGETDDIINTRLKVYHSQTEPILEYYRDLGILLEVNGERLIDEIAKDIILKID